MNLLLKSFYCLLLCSFSFGKAQENLIPYPNNMTLGMDSLDLSHGITADWNKELFKFEGQIAIDFLKENNIALTKTQSAKSPRFRIYLNSDLKNNGKEAYELEIGSSGISVSAADIAGIFYALQTLRQMEIKNQKIRHLKISDHPAFGWRGFLVDVGRNFQPVDLLKQQLDVMAKYKLNVFHFHFTEDIAWRLASKKYPGITEASNMTRWKEDFYTEKEFRDLINYAKERHIVFLPEIDMPGHSEAFKRFFGVDMQSAQGMVYIKELLKEFKETYPDLEYLHIGGDEVKISNLNFLPEITKYVEQLGFKTTVGWSPGSNLLPETIKQLWMGGPSEIPKDGRFIDSKHLYLNHMDPLETVTTLFYRKLGNSEVETSNLLGATLCSWPDRAVGNPEDVFLQSAIYPGILTFAERSWKGGGRSEWICNLPASDLDDFKKFEARLIFHKDKYFKDLPFPYVPQSDIEWELFGPYDNRGDLNQRFAPESNEGMANAKPLRAVGGTIILRHWWADLIKGAIDEPMENTTWYAKTKIWSDKAIEKPFWIGFANLSRSYASDSPPADTWDALHSQVFVNSKEIASPRWQHPGRKGDLKSPLVDEGYSYRKPTMIPLNKGWNTVLIKLPVASFQGKDWQNPVKWMFTFAPLEN